MPHLELRGQELDNAYPPLPVPQDEILPDVANDEDDVVYQSGLRAAEAIRRETADHGRKHRMSPNAKEEPKKGSIEEQNKQENFEKVALVYDGYDLPYDVPETPQGTSPRRLRERGVITEHVAHDHDDHKHDDDDHDDHDFEDKEAVSGTPQGTSPRRLRKDKKEATLHGHLLGRRRSVCESLILRAFWGPNGRRGDPNLESRRVVERSESPVFSSEILERFCISHVSLARASCAASARDILPDYVHGHLV